MGKADSIGAFTLETPAVFPIPQVIGVFGALVFLAAQCPRHRDHSMVQLQRLFLPAVEHQCVRLFQNAEGMPCAALIWARLSSEVSSRMVDGNIPPAPAEWISGDELWFMDILAPFGHGRVVARHLARNPPAEAFRFARIGPDGRVRKVVSIGADEEQGRDLGAARTAGTGSDPAAGRG